MRFRSALFSFYCNGPYGFASKSAGSPSCIELAPLALISLSQPCNIFQLRR